MKKLTITFIVIAAFLSSCVVQKQPSLSSNDYTKVKIKNLPIWQLRKTLNLEPYSITDISRSWIKSKSTGIGVNSVTYTKTQTNYSISFSTSIDELRADVSFANQYTDSELSVFSEHISIPIDGLGVLKGGIALNNGKSADFIIVNESGTFFGSSEGLLFFEGQKYQINAQLAAGGRLTFHIMKGGLIMGRADDQGNIEIRKSETECLKSVKVSVLSALIFNHLNQG